MDAGKMSWPVKVAVGAVSLAVAAVGVAGAVGTYTNAADLVGGGFALSMVAGGEGVVAVCATVMLLLTVLGRPSPAALRVATVAMPVVASAVGAVVAPDVTTKVIMAVGPLAMTAAAEGLCLVARNAVAVATGVDVEADRRAMQRAASLDKHAAKDGRLSKRIVTRTRRQLVAVDPKAAELVAGAVRRQVAADVTARMAAIGAQPVEQLSALDAATPTATQGVAVIASGDSKVDQVELASIPLDEPVTGSAAVELGRALVGLPALAHGEGAAPAAPKATVTVVELEEHEIPAAVRAALDAMPDRSALVEPDRSGEVIRLDATSNGISPADDAPDRSGGANLRAAQPKHTDEELMMAGRRIMRDLDPPRTQNRFFAAMRAEGFRGSRDRLTVVHKAVKAELEAEESKQDGAA